MKKQTPRTDVLESNVKQLFDLVGKLNYQITVKNEIEETVKILEERIDDLEQTEFKGILDKLQKKDDNVVVKVTVNGHPVVELHKGAGSKVPFTFIPRATEHICGNCEWGSANICILGKNPNRPTPFDKVSCPSFGPRQFHS